MRIKQTGRRKSKAPTNGNPSTPKAQKVRDTPDTQNMKSPQPQELTELDRRRLREFLDHNDRPFDVHLVPASKKRKRTPASLQEQNDLFEERLTVQYEIKPWDKWSSLKRYKKFTVGSESIGTGECILVKHDESEEAKMDVEAQWKAKVLEVRALDQEHVYIRVAWLNRPEDLPEGRKKYHGKNELIPTNQMDIIDAMAVNGPLAVRDWNDFEDDGNTMPEEDQYFWRQTYDFANTKTFSKLRTICIDESPQNPDQLIVQCSAENCRKWMHVLCIAEQTLKTSLDEAKSKRWSKSQKRAIAPKNDLDNSEMTAIAESRRNGWLVQIFFRGQPDRAKSVPAQEDEIVITDPDGNKHSEEVCCLFCHSVIE